MWKQLFESQQLQVIFIADMNAYCPWSIPVCFLNYVKEERLIYWINLPHQHLNIAIWCILGTLTSSSCIMKAGQQGEVKMHVSLLNILKQLVLPSFVQHCKNYFSKFQLSEVSCLVKDSEVFFITHRQKSSISGMKFNVNTFLTLEWLILQEKKKNMIFLIV